jgi:predicted phosphodiesterase
LRIAVLADVQGNLPALEAVLDEIDALPRPAERIICAGDVVGLGPQPNEVLEVLRKRDVETITGNYDDAVAFDRLGSGMDFVDVAAEELDQRSISWTRETLTPENLTHLRSLPRDVRVSSGFGRIEVKRDEGKDAGFLKTYFGRLFFGDLFKPRRSLTKKVLVVHGSPRALNEFVRPDTATSILRTVSGEARADVMVSAHAGVSFHRETSEMTFVGVGGVSGPLATPGEAEYAVIDVDERTSVIFGRARYNNARGLRAVKSRDLRLVR